MSDPLVLRRLIDYYYKEKEAEVYKTMAIIHAILKSDDLQDVISNYVDSVFPTGKINKQFVENNKEKLEEEVERRLNNPFKIKMDKAIQDRY